MKTNVLRILDQKKIPYTTEEYTYDEDFSGIHVASQVSVDADDIYKTLVLTSKNGYLVCCIPVNHTIDLKKLAKASKNKKVEMIKQKDLLSVTGYIRGGCSPIGMKKNYPIYIDESILDNRNIAVSAGKRGIQVILNSLDLLKITNAKTGDFIKL